MDYGVSWTLDNVDKMVEKKVTPFLTEQITYGQLVLLGMDGLLAF